MAKVFQWSCQLSSRYLMNRASELMKPRTAILLQKPCLPLSIVPSMNFTLFHALSYSKKETDPNDTKSKAANTGNDEKIIVLDMSGKPIGKMTLEEAKDLAAKEIQKLVDLSEKDAVEHRDVYQLENFEKVYQLENFEKKTKTKTKLQKLKLKSTISDNDMQVKIKYLHQWMEKGCDIKVTIKNMNNEKAAAKLFKMICKAVAPFGKVPKAQTSPHEIVMHITHQDHDTKATDTKPKLLTNEELKKS